MNNDLLKDKNLDIIKHPITSSLSTGFAALALLVFSSTAQAATIVEFSTATQTDTNLGNNAGSFGLNLVTPTLATGTSDYAGKSIYGAFSENVGTTAIYNINKTTGGARIRWNSSPANEDATALFLFRKDEFLNGLDTATVSMDAANDTITAKFSVVNGGDPGKPRIIKRVFTSPGGPGGETEVGAGAVTGALGPGTHFS